MKVLGPTGDVLGDEIDTLGWKGEIRTRAAHDLRFHHCREVIEPLVRAIADDPHLWVKRAAAESLAIATAGDFNPRKVFSVEEAKAWWDSRGQNNALELPTCDLRATTNRCNANCLRHLEETR